MRIRNERAAGRRVAAKLAAIKRAAGDEAEDVIDDVSDALDVEKDDVVEVVVDDPDGLVAELEVAGETELAGEVQEISLKVRQDYDGDEDEGGDVDDGPREARRRAARMAARRRMAQASRGRGSRRRSAGAGRRAQAPRKNAAGSRQTLASMLRKAYSWDLLEDFAEAMGVSGDPDGKAQNTLDALANGQENVQDYVAFLREDGDEFKSKVADELLSEFGKADLAPEPGEQQAEPTIDVDDVKPTVDTGDDEGAMPYGVDDPVEARRAAARKAAMRAAKDRRSAKPSAPKGGVRVSRRSAVAGVAGQKPQEDNTTVDKSAFLFV